MAKKNNTTSKSTRNATAKTKPQTQTPPPRNGATRGGTSNGRPKRPSTSSRPTHNTSPSRRPVRRPLQLNLQQKVLIFGIVTVFLTAVLILSLLSPNQGQLTTALSNHLWQAFGWGGFLVPLICGALGLYLVLWGMDQPPAINPRRVIGFTIVFLVLEAFATLADLARFDGFYDIWQLAHAQAGGGYVGSLFAFIFTRIIGDLGAIFILIVLGLLGGILASGVTRQELSHFWQQLQKTRTPSPTINPSSTPLPATPKRTPKTPAQPSPAVNTPPPTAPTPPTTPPPTRRPVLNPNRQPAPPPPTTEPAPQLEPATAMPLFLGRFRSHQQWKLPTITDMLEPGHDLDVNNTTIRQQVETIEHTLESFGAPATVVEINQGPTVTQFGVEPNFIETRGGKRTKVKVGKIASLADDMALALQAHSIRIQAPVPGKGYVGIEVPNPAKSLVSLRDIMESDEYQKIARKSPLSIGLGQNVSGQPISTDLTAMPHLLIAGTTGSGKSVCVNGIIACLLLHNTPEQLKLVMVDPKRVELTGYNGIPHLAAPVVVEMDRVIGTLQWALREMDHRYKLFAEIGARNITDYNKKLAGKENAEPLPYIVIIIDELADLMMLAPEDTERAITRLAQMARATGIHMVIATQRPSVDVVTGLIKANFPARIAFAVASSTDSRVILDSTGAERLLGQGDMLFQSPDAAAPVRLQGAFVSDKELTRLIEYWRTARRFNLIPAEESVTRTAPPPQEQTSPADSPPPNVISSPPMTAPPVAAPPVPPVAAPPVKRATRATAVPTPPPPQLTPTPLHVTPPEPPATAVPRPIVRPKPEPQQRPLWEELQASAETPPDDDDTNDEMLPEAIALVRKLNKASTSLLQRRFRIGYTRAARLIDIMEQQGVIGPPTGTSKARLVINPLDDSASNPQNDDAPSPDEADSDEPPNSATPEPG